MRRISSGFMGFSDATDEMAKPARPTPSHDRGAETAVAGDLQTTIWKRIREPATILTEATPEN
jgi:hypothetical protein